MARTILFRPLITLLLAAWMPFCCCSLRSVVAAHISRETADDRTTEHYRSNRAAEGCGCGRDDNETAPCHSDKPAPKNGPCTCNKHKLATIGVEKNTIEFSTPILAYVVMEWDVSVLQPRHSSVAQYENRALHKPQTSLLRQHCALTI